VTRRRQLAAALGLVALAAPVAAHAQEFPTIRDRDYTLDLHQGAVLGSGRIVGMGGAAVATAEGSSGLLFNPAAVAVRPATSTGTWDWDWHLDWLTPQIGTDFDNNGLTQETDVDLIDALITGGLVGQYGPWGLGVTVMSFAQPLEREADGSRVVPRVAVVRASLARSLWADQITVGVGLRAGTFSIARRMESEAGAITETVDLFSLTGTGLEAGAIWRPRDLDLRAGLSASLPVSSEEVEVANCDPLACEGFVLPERAAAPWQLSLGVAWRRAATRWNRTVATTWRDERYLLLAADLVVTGHVPHGHGVEAFSRMQLQPSGRDVGVSPRLGAEYEWLPGRLRVRGGSYWEPSRFRDPRGEDVRGRLHLTLGLDVRIWQFCFWNERYRLRLSVTGDGADGYGNGGLSIGFWH